MTKRYFLFLVIALCIHLLMYFCFSGNVRKKNEQEKNSKSKVATFRMVDLPEQKLSSPVKEKTVTKKTNTAPKKNHKPQAKPIENTQPAPAEQSNSAPEKTDIDNCAKENKTEIDENELFFNAAEVSVLPALPARALRQRLHYPKDARQRGIEGVAYLQLYINSKGVVEKVEILHEKPDSSYGFGIAAKNALLGLKGSPAKFNGKAVGVIFRYPVRFTLEK